MLPTCWRAQEFQNTTGYKYGTDEAKAEATRRQTELDNKSGKSDC